MKQTDQEVYDFYARQSSTPIPGIPKFDAKRVVDGQRSIIFHKPLPTTSQGKIFEVQTKVIGVYDKGKVGTVVETETILREKGGDVYTTATGSGFFVGQGNWGGPKGERTRWMLLVFGHNAYCCARTKNGQLSSTGGKEAGCYTHPPDERAIRVALQVLFFQHVLQTLLAHSMQAK